MIYSVGFAGILVVNFSGFMGAVFGDCCEFFWVHGGCFG